MGCGSASLVALSCAQLVGFCCVWVSRIWGCPTLGCVAAIGSCGGVLILVVRGRSAGWTQLGVIRGGAGGLLELAAGGLVGVGVLVVLEDVAVMQ